MLQGYWVLGPLLRAISSLYTRSVSCVRILCFKTSLV
uniref:Uncharacterized protein n=1 Tax=Anguilla anguilla TaxID=7936 RepID=A0A0E9RJX8_ANGAN